MVMEDANKKRLCTIYLVRHGETEWNVGHRIQGQANSPLTKQGQKQALELGSKLKSVHFDAIFSSDLGRARETAELIALSKKIAIKTAEALRERSFGDQEGKTWREYNIAMKGLLDKFALLNEVEKARFKFSPDSESNEELARRMSVFLREIAVAYAGKRVLAVSHGGIIIAFLISLGFGTYDELWHKSRLKNTAYMILESDGTDFFIKEVYGLEKL